MPRMARSTVVCRTLANDAGELARIEAERDPLETAACPS